MFITKFGHLSTDLCILLSPEVSKRLSKCEFGINKVYLLTRPILTIVGWLVD